MSRVSRRQFVPGGNVNAGRRKLGRVRMSSGRALLPPKVATRFITLADSSTACSRATVESAGSQFVHSSGSASGRKGKWNGREYRDTSQAPRRDVLVLTCPGFA